jgi:hypothetical protein
MSKVSGRCLCGSVTYQSNAEPTFTAVCHCTHCQRSGGAFSVNLGMPAESVQVSGATLANYEDMGTSGNGLNRMFCSKCGSAVATDAKLFPGVLFIKAGTLDDSSWVKPGLHIWTDSAQSWVIIDANVQKVPKNPG